MVCKGVTRKSNKNMNNLNKNLKEDNETANDNGEKASGKIYIKDIKYEKFAIKLKLN